MREGLESKAGQTLQSLVDDSGFYPKSNGKPRNGVNGWFCFA